MADSEIQNVLKMLEDDLGTEVEGVRTVSAATPKHNDLLHQLRNLTFQSGCISSLSTERAVSICCRYSFDVASVEPNRIAVRCLCNILFLAEQTRQMFVSNERDYPGKAALHMKSTDPDDVFTSARLLLFCTYETDLDFEPLFQKYEFANTINQNIGHYARLIPISEGTQRDTLERACTETLKLLYNLIDRDPYRATLFDEALYPILDLLSKASIPSPPLQLLISSLINPLNQLELKEGCPLLVESSNNIYLQRLVLILDLASQTYSAAEMNIKASPLVQVLLRATELSPPGVASQLGKILLPSEQDRQNVLGKNDSLPSRLLRLFNNPAAPELSALLPALYFELSDRDVDLFVSNVGYGLAAGYLASRGLYHDPAAHNRRVTEDSKEDSSIPTENARLRNSEINTITGQWRKDEIESELPELTEDEKEREAEKLFVLFERLKATGVINVENPVARAVHEGRFEELE
ncbi:hypothetical protein AAFC00_002713 [Neodothiora populina]|uniref:Synembryn-A n=2 Tax=Neodothiora populina TaxID=2781224 RepID=A0ABR3P7Z4_9PEZI